MITTLHLFTIHLLFSPVFFFQTLSEKMDISTNSQSSSHNSKENIPPSSKVNALQVRRAKQRTVLGMLSGNEQHDPSHSQVGKKSKVDRMSGLSVNLFLFIQYNIYFFATGKPVFHIRQLPARLLRCSIQFGLRCVRRRGSGSCSFRIWWGSGVGRPRSRYRDFGPTKWRRAAPTGTEFMWVWTLQNLPPCVSCPFANCDSLLQVRARILPRSLMSPWCRRGCHESLIIQRTFTNTWETEKWETTWTVDLYFFVTKNKSIVVTGKSLMTTGLLL